MSITCTFQQINKDYNSTRSAADSSAAYSCNVRDGCGVITPVLEIVDSMSFNPADYTHVYIPSFHRTYWITEAKFINRKWVVTGQVDVLITYKNAILGSTQYVLRSSSEYDTLVTDNLVYRKCKTKFSYHYQPTNFVDPANIGSGGCFVVGVVGKESSSGMVTY